MADKATPVILEALSRAVAAPAGSPLHSTRSTPGLFATTPLARQAAQRCLEAGYLGRTSTPANGSAELFALTERGRSYLLEQVSPRQVLEDLVRALEAREAQLRQLTDFTRSTQADLQALRQSTESILRELQPNRDWTPTALDYLARRSSAEDCPLPELYRSLPSPVPSLGLFHDGLRRLREQGLLYLHPWTGPLHEMPEPAYALLVGHEIAYYASRRL